MGTVSPSVLVAPPGPLRPTFCADSCWNFSLSAFCLRNPASSTLSCFSKLSSFMASAYRACNSRKSPPSPLTSCRCRFNSSVTISVESAQSIKAETTPPTSSKIPSGPFNAAAKAITAPSNPAMPSALTTSIASRSILVMPSAAESKARMPVVRKLTVDLIAPPSPWSPVASIVSSIAETNALNL